MSFGLTINTGGYSFDTITPASFAGSTVLSCIFVDGENTTYYVDYPHGWSPSTGIVKTNDNNPYFAVYQLFFEDSNSRIRVVTRNSWAYGASPPLHGSITFLWFYKTLPNNAEFGLRVRNGNGLDIISSEYPVYYLAEEGTLYSNGSDDVPMGSVRWHHYYTYPSFDEEDIVVFQLDNSVAIARPKYGTIEFPDAQIVSTASSLNYRIFRKTKNTDPYNTHGLRVFDANGNVTYNNNSIVAPTNCAFFDRSTVIGSNIVIDNSKPLWVALQKTQMWSTPLGMRDSYGLRAFMLRRTSSGEVVFTSNFIEVNVNRHIAYSDSLSTTSSYLYEVFQ